jgi:hypothetical protein
MQPTLTMGIGENPALTLYGAQPAIQCSLLPTIPVCILYCKYMLIQLTPPAQRPVLPLPSVAGKAGAVPKPRSSGITRLLFGAGNLAFLRSLTLSSCQM